MHFPLTSLSLLSHSIKPLAKRTTVLATTLAAALTFTLTGCANMDVNTYAQEKPALQLEQYFNGRLVGHGVFMDRGGEVKRRFVVVINATVVGDTITLDEQFTWSDGVKDARVWTLKKQPPTAATSTRASGATSSVQRWQGTAADVVGAATGTVAGNALNWRYVLALPVYGKTYHMDFDDWMYLVDDKVMINKAVMSKFGVRLGEVLISFTKG
jgi:Protein of unknown function (DUF3833)